MVCYLHIHQQHNCDEINYISIHTVPINRTTHNTTIDPQKHIKWYVIAMRISTASICNKMDDVSINTVPIRTDTPQYYSQFMETHIIYMTQMVSVSILSEEPHSILQINFVCASQ